MKPSALRLLVLGWLLIWPAAPPATAAVTASRGTIDLPTYPWSAVKHPYFRGTDNVNIYPYPMLDFLDRDKTNRTYRTVVLENEYLRVTFLPELGGKIHEVIDKTTGQPMFYVNHVIKPALIGQAGAWTSGGVEWNTGPQGHTVGCMQPVPVLILPHGKDGSQSVVIGETERIYGTKWTVVVTLRPGCSAIEERIRIYNATETIRPYYFWNCTAVPNTQGFRFIYPMTLGTDHGAEKFFRWPVDAGKDLSRGTNYQDASSIFAWHGDQDFFGSYNDDLDRGVVAYANHHQLPGKKAWTWGWGSYGTMHQMDLTDSDGPYNEVQTGPLLTQGEVGRLDPCEAVEWQEWWYPIHGTRGFTYANKDVAVQAERQGNRLALRAMSNREYRNVRVFLWRGSRDYDHPNSVVNLSPQRAASAEIAVPDELAEVEKFWIELRQGEQRLALFLLPLDLPSREPPTKKPAAASASEWAQAGWEDFLFARFPEAEANFRKALEADPRSVPAHTGLAFLRLDSDPRSAMEEAAQALATNPDSGLAHYARAVAADRAGDLVLATDEAWKAALDPSTATAARALVAKLETRFAGYRTAVDALASPGPWQKDSLCRNRLSYAALHLGDRKQATRLARESLAVDPLDAFAASILWLGGDEAGSKLLEDVLRDNPPALLDLVSSYADMVGNDWSSIGQVLDRFYLKSSLPRDPITSAWAAAVLRRANRAEASQIEQAAAGLPASGVFPHHAQAVRMLQGRPAREPKDGKTALFLGHLLFHLGRHAEGRALWQQAAALGTEPSVACRALGMAAKTLDGDLKSARDWLDKASQADPGDAIVGRDLANVLFALADQSASEEEKRRLATEARDRLQGAFAQGKGRSDFVALLARSHTRLGDHAATATLLDSVRITIWEGAHEAHDLFEEAHLALGDTQLNTGHPAEALAEFNRALEYPKNLATGRLENTCDAHIHYRRGEALNALGRREEARAAWKQAVAAPASTDPRKEAAREKARNALETGG